MRCHFGLGEIEIRKCPDTSGRSPILRWFESLNAAAKARVAARTSSRSISGRDAGFCKALPTEAVNAYLGGDETTGEAVLRDLVNATIGFERLAEELEKPGKSLHRMLGPQGNPRTANFFAILQVLQERIGLKLTVKVA